MATGLCFLLFGLGTLLLALLLTPMTFLLPIGRQIKSRFARKMIQLSAWLFVRIMWIMGLLSFEFKGLELLDRQGILIIANHPTLLDAIFLMSVIPNATFVVKAAMARNLVTRWMVSLAGYIPNDEGVGLLERAAATLKAGNKLMIFPEGTRTDDSGMQFKRGAANIALMADCLIVPVLIDCQPMTLRKTSKWYQSPETKPHFYFAVLPDIEIARQIDQNRPSGIQARQLTAIMQTRLADELRQLG